MTNHRHWTATRFRPSHGRPTIGLVLGSGAARGFAHIGVIHALMERGIIPDIIVGTSIGALVGGCYVDNQLDELEAWARVADAAPHHQLSRRAASAAPA